jgi:hypothetical protein
MTCRFQGESLGRAFRGGLRPPASAYQRSGNYRSNDALTDDWPIRVTVVDFDMPFGSLVTFLVKAWFASIVAAICLLVIVGIPLALVWAFLKSLRP